MHDIDLRRIDLNLLVIFEVLMAERNVTRAAARLARSQSAVSHALARLRGQVGDPLLVMVGGQMRPSPYAEALVEEVRPILAGLRRVLAPARAFEPSTSDRSFRVAIPDLAPSVFAALAERVLRLAPRARVEWVVRDAQVQLRVVEGQVDLALLPQVVPLAEGISAEAIPALRWATFARRGHPALRRWNQAAWQRWPHVAVRVSLGVASPVAAAAGPAPRRIVAWVPHFSAVAPLLARTDLIATLPLMAMIDSLDRHGLVALPVPFAVEPMHHRLLWSRRLDADPAIAWIRSLLRDAFAEASARADALRVRSKGVRR